MTEDDEIEFIWNLCIPRTNQWYNSDCPVIRTTKIELEKAWRQARKITDVKTVELAIQAQARYRKDERNAGKKPAQPKMISAWLNAGRWELEIPSHAELKERTQLNKCHCGREVHGPNYDVCTLHISLDKGNRFKDTLKTKEQYGKVYTYRPQTAVGKLRKYITEHPEIKTFNRQQSINFIRQKLKDILN